VSSAGVDPASIRIRVEVVEDADEVARRGALEIEGVIRTAVAARGSCAIAVSGGRTPWAMIARLAQHDIPWESLGMWQVDERIAPRGHQDRALTHLEASLPAQGLACIRAMPVDTIDPADDASFAVAADAYTATLPTFFDLIHLGLGDDGHTASLVPGDPTLDMIERDVAITGSYQGRRRMTLTFPVLDRAGLILWIAEGASKTGPLRRLIDRDPSIPASRVAAPNQLAIVDRAAGALVLP
jgi:6-phosphogluconolactonase